MNVELVSRKKIFLAETEEIYMLNDVRNHFGDTLHCEVEIPSNKIPSAELIFYCSEYQIVGNIESPIDLFTELGCIPLNRWAQLLITKYSEIMKIPYVSGDVFTKISSYKFPISLLEDDRGEKFAGIFNKMVTEGEGLHGGLGNIFITLNPAKKYFNLKEILKGEKYVVKIIHT